MYVYVIHDGDLGQDWGLAMYRYPVEFVSFVSGVYSILILNNLGGKYPKGFVFATFFDIMEC